MDVTEALLKGKADPEAMQEGLSLLLRAAHAGQTSVIKQLADYKADVDFVTPEGQTALHIATKLKNQDAVAALIEVKADLEKKDGEGLTPFLLAVLHNLQEPCKVLL